VLTSSWNPLSLLIMSPSLSLLPELESVLKK